MISNVKIPGLPMMSLEAFKADQNAEFGQIGDSWPSSNNIHRGKIIRKIKHKHPVSGIIQTFVVDANTLELFEEREAEVYILPAKTEFLYTIDE